MDIERAPDPEGSPLEKLITTSLLENVNPRLRQILSEQPTKDEVLQAFSYYDHVIADHLRRNAREVEQWANIHTHGKVMGDKGGGGWAPVGQQRVYAMRQNPAEVLEISAETGQQLNIYTLGPAMNDPWLSVDVNGNLTATTRTDIYRLGPELNLIWHAVTSDITFQHAVNADGSRIWGGGGPGVYMYDGANGSELAYSGTLAAAGPAGVSSLNANNAGVLAVGFGDGTTRKLNPDLTVAWTYSNTNQTARIGATSIDPVTGDVYAAGWLTNGIGAVNKISSDGSSTLWSNVDAATQSTALVLAPDAVYHGGSSGRYLARIDADTGVRDWVNDNGNAGVQGGLAVDPEGHVWTAVDPGISTRGVRKWDALTGNLVWYESYSGLQRVVALPGKYEAS